MPRVKGHNYSFWRNLNEFGVISVGVSEPSPRPSGAMTKEELDHSNTQMQRNDMHNR